MGRQKTARKVWTGPGLSQKGVACPRTIPSKRGLSQKRATCQRNAWSVPETRDLSQKRVKTACTTGPEGLHLWGGPCAPWLDGKFVKIGFWKQICFCCLCYTRMQTRRFSPARVVRPLTQKQKKTCIDFTTCNLMKRAGNNLRFWNFPITRLTEPCPVLYRYFTKKQKTEKISQVGRLLNSSKRKETQLRRRRRLELLFWSFSKS